MLIHAAAHFIYHPLLYVGRNDEINTRVMLLNRPLLPPDNNP